MKRLKIILNISAFLISFLLSSNLVWGAETGEGELSLMPLLWRFINLAIFAYIIYWLGSNTVKDYLKNRRQSIEEAISEAQRAKEDADKKHREYAQRLETIQKQIDNLFAELREEGEKERDKIINEALEFSKKIKEQAKLAAEQEAKKVMAQIKEEVAELVTRLAEETLKKELIKEDQARLVENFLKRVDLRQ